MKIKQYTINHCILSICTVLVCLAHLHCVRGKPFVPPEQLKKINFEKGFSDMTTRLKPGIFPVHHTIGPMLGVSINNTLATINKKGEFCLLRIDKEGRMRLEVIVEGFPKVIGNAYFSDNEHNALWMVRGRGVYTLDMASKKTGHIVATGDGNAFVLPNFLADPVNKYLLIKTLSMKRGETFILFDMLNNKEVVTSELFVGQLLPFYNNQLLHAPSLAKGDKTFYDWQVIDYNMKVQKENKLVKQLRKFQLNVWEQSKTIHLGKRMILGVNSTSIENMIYYSIRWDEKIEKVKVEPFTIQEPKGVTIGTSFHFSQDGNWVKSTADRSNDLFDAPELIIFHVASVYPQGLSRPIFLGYTKSVSSGAFMQHDEWGPCYVEHDFEFPKKLFVYKLNKGLEILRDEAVDFVKE